MFVYVDSHWCHLPGTEEEKGTFSQRDIYALLLSKQRESRKLWLCLLFLSCLHLKISLCQTGVFGVADSHPLQYEDASLVAQTVNNLPAIQETRVWSLGLEGSLEKGMAIHSSILAWRIPWTEEPRGPQSLRLQRVRHNWTTKHAHRFLCWRKFNIAWNLHHWNS